MPEMRFRARCIDCGIEFGGKVVTSDEVGIPKVNHVVFALLTAKDAENEGIRLENVGNCSKPSTSNPLHSAGFDEIFQFG